MTSLTAIRGFNDILPNDTTKWRTVETILTQVLDNYGYSQIRLPLVEETQLFARGVGEATDIVEKEMFSVSYHGDKADKNESASFALRPEGTAGCVRAVVEHNLLRGDNPKLWYMGAMFRYERPQKGRYRQFHQLGVESFGSELPDADAELIAMTAMMWRRLGISDHVTLQLNTLGDAHERVAYKAALVEYLMAHFDGLDDDSQRRVHTNPLRVLDSKDEQTQAILLAAPKLSDFLGDESRQHFEQVQNYLHALGIDFEINEKLVRGLDYYNKTVFEWVTDKLGSQATVCGGGRYDGLVGIVKGKPEQSAPAVGFAMGLERLILLMEAVNAIRVGTDCDVFVVASENVYMNAVLYANTLRTFRPSLRVKMASASSLKSQMKKADKSGAKYTVIIGQDEVQNGTVSVKNMATGEQFVVDMDDIFFDIADDKPKAYDLDTWQAFVGDCVLPDRWAAFLDFAKDYPQESDFAQGFYVDFDDEKSGLVVWSDDEQFLSRLYPFAQANGTGSFYAFWRHDDNQDLNQAPIVIFGDEGGEFVVAQNFDEWLELLSFDVEVIVYDDEVSFYKDDEDWTPSDYYDDYAQWLTEQGLTPISTQETIDDVVAKAQEKYQAAFVAWCQPFFDNE